MSRVETARAQLAQVEELLAQAPTDEALLSLAAELRESIRLSLSLESTLAEASSALPVTSWSMAPQSAHPAAHRSDYAVASSASASAASSSSSSSSSTVRSTMPDIVAPGTRCEVKQKDDKRWQAAFVQRRLPRQELELLRLCDGATLVAKEDEVRPIHPGAGLRLDFIKPGMRLHARYSGDGKFYPVQIKSRTEHGAVVTFEGYGNDEHVCVEHMRIEVDASPPPGAEGSVAASAAAAAAVPKHLQLLPTDSEEVKLSKLKKQRSIKRSAKEAMVDKVEEDKQAKWQAFQATSKRVKGAFTDPSAESLFSSASGDVRAKFGMHVKR